MLHLGRQSPTHRIAQTTTVRLRRCLQSATKIGGKRAETSDFQNYVAKNLATINLMSRSSLTTAKDRYRPLQRQRPKLAVEQYGLQTRTSA